MDEVRLFLIKLPTDVLITDTTRNLKKCTTNFIS
jgi:hypothetical protein